MSENLEAKVGKLSSKNIWNRAARLGKKAFIYSALGAALLAGCSPGGGSSDSGGSSGGSGGNPSGNHAPVIYSSPVTQVNENSPYSYDVNASDSDGDSLTYLLSSALGWLSINSSTGLITGTAPDVGADISYPVNVRVSDGKTSTDQSYNLIVKNVSSTPTSPTTKVLPDSTLATIADFNGSSITFLEPMTFVNGDILGGGISAATPYGILVEVTGVSSDRKTFSTQASSIAKAAPNGLFSMRKTLLPSDVSSSASLNGISEFSNAATGYNFNYALNNVVLFDADGSSSTTNDRVTASGDLSFNVTSDVDLNLIDHATDTFLFQIDVDQQSNLSLNASFAGFAPKRIFC